MSMIQNESHSTIAHNLLFLKSAGEVLSAFKEDGISAIVLKGVALVETIYPNIGMREMSDIDLLIKDKDYPLASHRLRGLGYDLHPGTSVPTYVREGKIAVVVQLHTRLPYLNEKELWGNLIPIAINSEGALTLPLEQNLVYLCYHLAVSHTNSEQKWIEDIRWFITRYGAEFDWRLTVDLIRKYRLQAPCYFVFLEAKRRFDSEIPDFVLSEIKPRNGLRSRIFRDLFNERELPPYISYALPVLIDPRLILPYLFPSVRELKLRCNAQAPLVYLYYIVRPIYLVSRGLRGLIEITLRNMHIPITQKQVL
jgi:hypothetical protein